MLENLVGRSEQCDVPSIDSTFRSAKAQSTVQRDNVQELFEFDRVMSKETSYENTTQKCKYINTRKKIY